MAEKILYRKNTGNANTAEACSHRSKTFIIMKTDAGETKSIKHTCSLKPEYNIP